VINLETGNSVKIDDLDLGESLVTALYFLGEEHLVIFSQNFHHFFSATFMSFSNFAHYVSSLYCFRKNKMKIIGCSNGEMIVYDINTHKSKIYGEMF
jgi:hypothetical protein